jgi:methionyl-tRNA formyltransferase
MRFAFFGGEPLAVPVLQKLKQANLVPDLIVCNPDRPVGRKQVLTSPPAKVWAEQNNIEVFQPTNYQDGTAAESLAQTEWDLFVVVAYNFILPTWLLKLPKKGAINLHPSLLPRLRGASPIRTAILNNLPEEVGVTVMLLDEKMDHGPILNQLPLELTAEQWPMTGPELDSILAELGGELLASTIPEWLTDAISPQEQDHSDATYCSKLDKAEAELTIDPTALPTGEAAKEVWHTICAYSGIGEAYFIHKGNRIKINRAEFTNGGQLQILRVTPAGKSEMDFASYLTNL